LEPDIQFGAHLRVTFRNMLAIHMPENT